MNKRPKWLDDLHTDLDTKYRKVADKDWENIEGASLSVGSLASEIVRGCVFQFNKALNKEETLKELKPKDLIKNPRVKELVEALKYYANTKHFITKDRAYDKGIRVHTKAEEALKKWERSKND